MQKTKTVKFKTTVGGSGMATLQNPAAPVGSCENGGVITYAVVNVPECTPDTVVASLFNGSILVMGLTYEFSDLGHGHIVYGN